MKRINIAIIGGGISGTAFAVGLLKYPHINVKIYEAAPRFEESMCHTALPAEPSLETER